MSVEIDATIAHVDYDTDGRACTIVIHPNKPPSRELAFVTGKPVHLVVMEGRPADRKQASPIDAALEE